MLYSQCRRHPVQWAKFLGRVDDLVHDGSRTFTELSLPLKKELVGLLLQATDDHDRNEWFSENRNSDIMNGFFAKYLCESTAINENVMLHAFVYNAIDYYEDSMNVQFSEIVSLKCYSDDINRLNHADSQINEWLENRGEM